MIQFKQNTQTDGQKDGQTLYYRILPATAGGPKTMNFEKHLYVFMQEKRRYLYFLFPLA